MMKETIIVAVALLLSACATGSNLGPAYVYEEIVVVNNSKQPIRNLTIRVAGSGDGSEKILSCENIIALGICQERFTQRRYKGGGFIVDWVSGDSDRQTADIEAEVSAYSSPGTPLRVVFTISREDVISAYFERSWRFR
jgi:hypothetical protein